MMANLRGYIDGLDAAMFVTPEQRKLFGFIIDNPDFSGTEGKLIKKLNTLAEYVKIVALQYEELYTGVDLLELQYEAARLRTRLVEYYVKDQKKQITDRMKDADEAETLQFLKQARDLDQLLKRTKE